MNLYGTLYDGGSLKRDVGVEIETFEMLEMQDVAGYGNFVSNEPWDTTKTMMLLYH